LGEIAFLSRVPRKGEVHFPAKQTIIFRVIFSIPKIAGSIQQKSENGSQNRTSPNEFTASTNLGRNREPKPIIVNAIEKTNRLD
jgi:hypothetical protein